MRRILLATASTIAISTSAAMAADLGPMPTKAPAPIPASWTGGYVGLNAGYAWGNADGTTAAGSVFTPADLNVSSLRPKGFIGGGQVGFNWQTGPWVLGGEVDFSGMSVKADRSVNPFFVGKGTPNSATLSSQYDWLLTARLRAGVTFAQNWLLYVTGGLAVTQAKDSLTASNFAGPNTSVTWSDSQTLVGGTIGGGLEYAFAPNWSMKVEYLYAKFNDTTPTETSSSNVGFPVRSVATFSHDLNIVRAGINYKFGG
jgi:outer membrane immunogenic protein